MIPAAGVCECWVLSMCWEEPALPPPSSTLREAVVFNVFTETCVAFVQMAFYVNTGCKTHPEELLWGGEGPLAYASPRQLHREGLKIIREFRFPVCVPANVLNHRTQ